MNLIIDRIIDIIAIEFLSLKLTVIQPEQELSILSDLTLSEAGLDKVPLSIKEREGLIEVVVLHLDSKILIRDTN